MTSPQALFAMGQGIESGSQTFSSFLDYQTAKSQSFSLHYQAGLVEEEAIENEEILTERYEELEGRQIKQLSVSGRRLEGSALLILDETREHKFQDIKNLRIDARRRATSLRLEGKSRKSAAKMRMYGSLLGSAGAGLSAYGKSNTSK